MIKDVFSPLEIEQRQVAQLIEQYLESISNSCRANTLATYSQALEQFVAYFSSTQNFFFLVEDIEQYKIYLEKTKVLEENTVKTYLMVLGRFCNYLIKCGMMAKNPVKRIKFHSKKNENAAILSLSQIRDLLSSFGVEEAIALRDKAIIYLMLSSGASYNVIINSNRENIKKLKGEYYFTMPNGRIKLKAELSEIFQEYLNSMPQKKANMPLFTSYCRRNLGQRLSQRGLRQIISNRLKTIFPEKKYNPYIIRHTAIALMREKL